MANPLLCLRATARLRYMPQMEAAQPGGSEAVRQTKLRRMVMKKQTLLFAALCLLIGSTVIPAYGQTATLKVKIPFNFVLGDKIYPAGEYAFSAAEDNVIVQNSVGARIAMRMANHVTGRAAGKNGQVIFDC